MAIRPFDGHLLARAARLKRAFARGNDYSGPGVLSRDDCALFCTLSKRPARLGFVHALVDGETGELDVLFPSRFSVAARQETQNGHQQQDRRPHHGHFPLILDLGNGVASTFFRAVLDAAAIGSDIKQNAPTLA